MPSEEMEGASPPWGHTRMRQRDSGHLAGPRSARWSGTVPAISRAKRWVEAVVKPGEDGAYVPSALKLHLDWEGPRKKGQGFKPDRGNSAVRHYRRTNDIMPPPRYIIENTIPTFFILQYTKPPVKSNQSKSSPSIDSSSKPGSIGVPSLIGLCCRLSRFFAAAAA
jgi:hypothetical protein